MARLSGSTPKWAMLRPSGLSSQVRACDTSLVLALHCKGPTHSPVSLPDCMLCHWPNLFSFKGLSDAQRGNEAVLLEVDSLTREGRQHSVNLDRCSTIKFLHYGIISRIGIFTEQAPAKAVCKSSCESNKPEPNFPVRLIRQRQPMAEDGGAAAAVKPGVSGRGAQVRRCAQDPQCRPDGRVCQGGRLEEPRPCHGRSGGRPGALLTPAIHDIWTHIPKKLA